MKSHPDDHFVDGEMRSDKCWIQVYLHAEEDGDRLHPNYPEIACYLAKELS